jgi:hypothetical protein
MEVSPQTYFALLWHSIRPIQANNFEEEKTMAGFKECREAVIIEEGRKKVTFLFVTSPVFNFSNHHYLFTDPFMIFKRFIQIFLWNWHQSRRGDFYTHEHFL